MTNPQPNLPLYIDSSMLSTFRSCPKKFYWQYMQKLKPMGFSIHLTAGAAYASALDAIRSLQAKSKEPIEAELLMEHALPYFLSSWDGPLNEDEIPSRARAKNIHNMLAVLELYLKEYHPFYDNIQPYIKPDGNAATEFSFAIPLPILHPSGEQFTYVGRFDMLGIARNTNEMVVLDDKTTGGLSSYWLDQWDMRGQFMGYIWACKAMGYPVDKAVVRGTGIQITDTKFVDVDCYYPDHLILRWQNELFDSLELMKMMAERNHWPYSFGDACTSYGGCPMKQLCQAAEPQEWFNNYERNDWSPVSLRED